MKKNVVFAAISILFFLTSCEHIVYKKAYTFDSLAMPRSEFVFEFNNETEKVSYDVILLFRYITGFQYKQAVFNFGLKSGTNDPISSVLGIPVRNKKGEYIGDGSGDIWDIEQVVLKNVCLPKGLNVFTLKHEMPQDTVQYVQEIGYKIVPSK